MMDTLGCQEKKVKLDGKETTECAPEVPGAEGSKVTLECQDQKENLESLDPAATKENMATQELRALKVILGSQDWQVILVSLDPLALKVMQGSQDLMAKKVKQGNQEEKVNVDKKETMDHAQEVPLVLVLKVSLECLDETEYLVILD